MRKQPTSIDVAKRAGVSQATVSFVLNNRADKTISAETRQRVLDAARELLYRSNRLSNGILRGRTGLVGVVIPAVSEDYFGRIISGICNEAARNGCQVLLGVTGQRDSAETEHDHVARLMEYRIDGIICVAYDWDSAVRTQWLDEVLAKHVAVAIVDDSTHASRTDCIVTDDVLGAQLAVRHLIEQGHRRIAHIAGNPNQSTGRDRLLGYRSALESAGIAIDESLILGGSYTMPAAAAAAETLLGMSNRPTAVFAASDRIAAPLIARIARLGLRCPGDIAVAGYSDTDVASSLDLSSVAQHPEEIGRKALSRLLQRVADPALPPELVTMPVELVARGSSLKTKD